MFVCTKIKLLLLDSYILEMSKKKKKQGQNYKIQR